MATKIDNLIRDICTLFPEPVSEEAAGDGVRLIGGDPGEVVAFVNGDDVVFSQFALEWDGPHSPVIRPVPIATVCWVNLLKKERQRLFTSLVEMIVKRRRKLYRTCQYCEENTPPEWLHDDQTCQSCAERHLGIVH